MRKSGQRVRTAVAVLTAAVFGLTGCDALGGDAPDEAGLGRQRAEGPAVLWDRSPASIVAVGDSITRGFDACGVLVDCPQVSWATGSSPEVNSLAVRLLGARATTHSWNVAVSGTAMADLPAQMERAAARGPELVTVMTGANDACRSSVSAMTPVDDFRADFKDAMRTLRQTLPKAQVYVASIPNLMRLWSEGRTNPLGKQVWKLGICPSMLGDADALDAAANQRRATVQQRVMDYNSALAEVCGADEYCRYDGGAVFDYRFGTAQLSPWDWFHPSKNGQARLAEIAFRRITAEKP
ncbi:SGNH/GDSL hydrolase family protein [Streptomyces chromofuscus]|uniref:SGNH/GDSL hydrolase family protein n=1 Tax=Streptomyces chromofuscus TaxID=42881 RepID=A0A7M2TE88_STRCW|nr:SGNH/GDSL hydrolase family protein [Streptomyces chromofuscus]QOV46459.1 SGNH/GDSL hydrolase family protein [Streptomyces chromofuscus]GGS94140.1 lipoprotein [Streptomyces chromofuscus]